MKIAIIGGSIGGLVTGIAFQKLGIEVDIYERSPSEMEGRGAGLVIQPALMEFIVENGIASASLFGVPAKERQILDEEGIVISRFRNDASFTSWNYLWKQLKSYFPSTNYHYNSRLSSITQENELVFAQFDDGKEVVADLIIGADGYDSTVRKHFLPDVKPSYSGYIAYRGLIREEDLSPDEINFFSDRFSLYPYAHSHLLAYTIPGYHGELSEGHRLLNWVWFVNQTHAELDKVLTDSHGTKRQYSIPSGFLSNSSLAELHSKAQKELPAILAERVLQTENPFVQVISDMEVPKMYEGRLAILGDAAFVIRPHTASGTLKAYEDGISLAGMISKGGNLSHTLAQWNERQLKFGRRLMDYGKMLGEQSGLGHAPGG
jgi:2-polyprenyl-6-methoxyphenol hydroxylase-like FAD-dependent oxidoreductase